MSSTSSSDCDNCDCSQCTYLLENNHNEYGELIRASLKSSRHTPMYATMAHPFIYYAEVQQPLNRRQANDQPKKENPFKKAFKWYTQERTLSNKHEPCPEKCEFADWLDGKYVQYLIECGQQPGRPTSHEPQPTIANVECLPCPPCPGKNKKFARIKSPWRKRRRSANDSGDVPEKCSNKSCEFLLKPKDLSRAASDNCYNTPTSGGKSNATVTSSNVPCNVKCSVRSHSLSDVCHEKSVPRHTETVPHTVQEGPRPQAQEEAAEQVPSKKQCSTKHGKIICKCHQEKVPAEKKVPSKKQNELNQSGIGKYPLEKVPEEKNQHKPCCKCNQETTPEVEEVSLGVQSLTNQSKPTCKCSQKKESEIEEAPPKEQIVINPNKLSCKCSQKKESEIEEVPPKEQIVISPNKLSCKCSQKKESEIDEAQPIEQIAINPTKLFCKCSQKKDSEVEQEPPKDQIAMNMSKPCCKYTQKDVSEEEKASKRSSTDQISNNKRVICKCPHEKVPKIRQVPSKEQDPENQPKSLCCKCHLKKVPEIVQVPSQSRTVEGSCQYPQVVPVNEETQYEPARLEPLRSAPNVRQGNICNTCKALIPPLPFPSPPPLLCLPIQVQTSTIKATEVSCTMTVAETNLPKKQIQAEKPSVSCSFCGKKKTKIDAQSQHQCELSEVPAPCPNHEVNQVYGPIPIRRQSHSTVAINEETGEISIVKEVAVVSKLTRAVTCVSSEAAQTSDHSIKFDQDGACCHYPLFFKIIYGDALKNECCS